MSKRKNRMRLLKKLAYLIGEEADLPSELKSQYQGMLSNENVGNISDDELINLLMPAIERAAEILADKVIQESGLSSAVNSLDTNLN